MHAVKMTNDRYINGTQTKEGNIPGFFETLHEINYSCQVLRIMFLNSLGSQLEATVQNMTRILVQGGSSFYSKEITPSSRGQKNQCIFFPYSINVAFRRRRDPQDSPSTYSALAIVL